MQKRNIKFLLPVGLCACYIFADIFFQESLFKKNQSFAKSLQSTETTAETNFCKFMSQLGGPYFYLGVLLLLFWYHQQKVKIITLIIVCLTSVYFNSLLKLIYADPRPFYAYDVKALSCEEDYGNPSGHAMNSIFIYFVFLQILYNMVITHYKVQWGIIFFCIYFIFVIFIAYSRVYLGVHSFNQVLLGWAYGLLILLCYYWFISYYFERFLINLCEDSNNYYTKKQQLIYSIIVLSILLIQVLFTILFFEICVASGIPTYWTTNLEAKCSDITEYHYFYNKCILDSAFCSLCAGMIIGAIASKGQYQEQEFRENFQSLSIWKKIARLLILCAVIALLVFPKKVFQPTNIYVAYIPVCLLMYFICGFLLIYLLPILYKLAQIDIDGDYKKISTQIPNSQFIEDSPNQQLQLKFIR